MLPTLHQLSIERNKRTSKIRRNKVAAFLGAPQRKGVIYKIATMSPRKPNSARRTFAKVRIIISKKKYLQRYQVSVIIFYRHILLF